MMSKREDMGNSAFLVALLAILVFGTNEVRARQKWLEQPSYQEVNPDGQTTINCKIESKKGECRWEKDGQPIGLYSGKYEWNGDPQLGDCSLRINNASLDYDDGVWQCQVTATNFTSKDALISQGAQLVVRERPSSLVISRVGDSSEPGVMTGSSGEDMELECTVRGGNPAPNIEWFVDDQPLLSGHSQDNRRAETQESRTWIATSRLVLPISKSDNGKIVRCRARHPTLQTGQSLANETRLNIHYAPSVRIESHGPPELEENLDSAKLKCLVDSNPSASITWTKRSKDDEENVLSHDNELRFEPVRKEDAGLYACVAENALGKSKAAFASLDVKFSPSILSVGPSPILSVSRGSRAVLTCNAVSNPPPTYQWLQQLSNHEVLIRGNHKDLVIDEVDYEHQGEFVCKAMTRIHEEERVVQSNPIELEVSGAPQIQGQGALHEVRVQHGEDALLQVNFCADPLPKMFWHLDDNPKEKDAEFDQLHFESKQDHIKADRIVLASGTSHGRFLAQSVQHSERRDCYVSALLIRGAHNEDSRIYRLRLENQHGQQVHQVRLVVRDLARHESLIAAAVAVVLTLLLLILLAVYCCRNSSNVNNGNGCKQLNKASDIESERTDTVSTGNSRSSSTQNVNDADKLSAIPPDAFYLSNERVDAHADNSFNESVMLFGGNASPSSLWASAPLASPARVVYSDLCFPKTSNYGSMRKKRNINNNNVGNNVGNAYGNNMGVYGVHVGVACRLDRV